MAEIKQEHSLPSWWCNNVPRVLTHYDFDRCPGQEQLLLAVVVFCLAGPRIYKYSRCAFHLGAMSLSWFRGLDGCA